MLILFPLLFVSAYVLFFTKHDIAKVVSTVIILFCIVGLFYSIRLYPKQFEPFRKQK